MTSGKVAIVTAGGSGMGAACARRLADDGYRVVIIRTSRTLGTSSFGITMASAPKAWI